MYIILLSSVFSPCKLYLYCINDQSTILSYASVAQNRLLLLNSNKISYIHIVFTLANSFLTTETRSFHQ